MKMFLVFILTSSSLAFGQTVEKSRLEKAREELAQKQLEIEVIKNSIEQQESERVQNISVAIGGGLIALGSGVVGKFLAKGNLNDGLHKSLIKTLIKFLRPQSILRKFHERGLLAALNLNRQIPFTKIEYFDLKTFGPPADAYVEMQASKGIFVVMDESFAPTFVHQKFSKEDLANMKTVFMPYVTSLTTVGYNGIRAIIRSGKIGDFKKDLDQKSKLLGSVQNLLNTLMEESLETP
jgi:hypothetical protein